LSYRIKLLLFLISAVAVFAAFDVGYSALNTMSRLDAVETERDRWQQPFDILRALELRSGDVAVDLGCGSGYFTLKLSSAVGRDGRVVAEDIRKLPLVFLWLRTVGRRGHNVRIVLGDPMDPHLPTDVNAVLILNTYHEIEDTQSILTHVSKSLVAGGRLVVVDRSPKVGSEGAPGLAVHEVAAERVARELREAGFEIVGLQDRFIDRDPDGESWWLISARKS
jgi:predicted methyltransferase